MAKKSETVRVVDTRPTAAPEFRIFLGARQRLEIGYVSHHAKLYNAAVFQPERDGRGIGKPISISAEEGGPKYIGPYAFDVSVVVTGYCYDNGKRPPSRIKILEEDGSSWKLGFDDAAYDNDYNDLIVAVRRRDTA